jgi:hypothetical protein
MNRDIFVAPRTTLQHANARMLNRYAPWLDYMLTITFGKENLQLLPDEENAKKQLRHLCSTLNWAVWGNRTRKNNKCQVLYVPIFEGGTDIKRLHAHILIGNVRSIDVVQHHMQTYIPRSNWLAPDFNIKEIYAADGASWYVGKELNKLNDAAVAWDIAVIPKPLLPR